MIRFDLPNEVQSKGKTPMRIQLVTALLLLVMYSTAIAQDEPRYSHTGSTMITGVRIIDGLGGEPKENQDIVLSDGKIASIGPAGAQDAPKDALVIDGKGMTTMPGLIDMHVHLQGGWANGAIRGDRYKPKYDDNTSTSSCSTIYSTPSFIPIKILS